MYNKVLDIILEICQDETLSQNPEMDLLDNDIIDSMAFLEIISALEDEFDIQIQPTQVPPNVWKNIKNITDFVENKIKEKE